MECEAVFYTISQVAIFEAHVKNMVNRSHACGEKQRRELEKAQEAQGVGAAILLGHPWPSMPSHLRTSIPNQVLWYVLRDHLWHALQLATLEYCSTCLEDKPYSDASTV